MNDTQVRFELFAEGRTVLSEQSGNSALRRIPTLDGWRGVAILLVLFAHLQIGYLKDNFFGWHWLGTGQLGVTIFFVLSGFLITSTLLNEDRVDLVRFYCRRSFRILPASWTYLLCLCVLTAATPIKVITYDLWSCLLFFRNYTFAPLNLNCTEHFWTLSMEEQFYLVWPIVLLLLKRKGSIVAAVAGVVAVAVFRFMNWSHYLNVYMIRRTEVRVDALLVGCLLAYLLRSRKVRDWFSRHGSLLFIGCLLFLAWDQYHFQNLIPTHESLVIALMIGATVSRPTMFASRFLEMSHLKTTGMLSYGFYLWQGLFLNQRNWGLYGIVLLPVATFASWFLIEKPGIELGRRVVSFRGRLVDQVPLLRPRKKLDPVRVG